MSDLLKEQTDSLPKDAFDILKKELDSPAREKARKIWKDFKFLTPIEKLGEEGFVLKSLMHGKEKTWILGKLQEKHPNHEIKMDHVNLVLKHNTKFLQSMGDVNKAVAERHIIAKVECEEALAELISFTNTLIQKYDKKEDAQNTIAAIKTCSNVLMNYAKLSGFIDEAQQKVDVNINLDKIVKSVTSEDSDFKLKIIQKTKNLAGQIVEAELVEEEENPPHR